MGHILMNWALSRNYYLRLEITEKPSLLDDICLCMYIYIHVLYDPHISFGWEKNEYDTLTNRDFRRDDAYIGCLGFGEKMAQN